MGVMTREEEKRIIEIYGPDYKEYEIPTYIRLEEFKREQELADISEELVDFQVRQMRSLEKHIRGS